MFPVMLQVAGRRCLVVGGGGVAFRKVQGLLEEGAEVTVVAPDVVPGLERLAREGRIRLERRGYSGGEAAGFALVFAATDSREVNRRVFEDASGAGVWVNVADDPELCTFHLPAVIRRGPLHLAVASGGKAPFAVRRLRRLLERRFGPEWGEWMAGAARFRDRIRSLGLSGACREAVFDRYFEATVDGGSLEARVLPREQEVRLLEAAQAQEPECRREAPAEAPARPAVRPGLVSLVGAGPGNPGLLTLRGYRRVMAADAVVYDRLAAPALPCNLPPSVELHCVGKTAGRHPVPQEEINAMLIRLAKEGKRVVRLKGGDPYVFGRGGEEAEALAAAGVPFEVVPGVTSGIAGPAWAGIPVTHRKEAVRVTLLTAHECAKSSGPQVRWDLLAQDDAATIVGYMGVTALPGVVARLLDGGMDPATPAAMVERGTTGAQRSVVATLATLPEAVEREGIRPPALFVIGPTVSHAERLDWSGRCPLVGRRVLLADDDGRLAEPLELAGAEVVSVHLPLGEAARVAVGALPLTDVVVASREQVEALDVLRGGAGWEGEPAVWCIGEDAWQRASEMGWSGREHVQRGDDDGELVARMASVARTAR